MAKKISPETELMSQQDSLRVVNNLRHRNLLLRRALDRAVVKFPGVAEVEGYRDAIELDNRGIHPEDLVNPVGK